jgi:hypothetical protein
MREGTLAYVPIGADTGRYQIWAKPLENWCSERTSQTVVPTTSGHVSSLHVGLV